METETVQLVRKTFSIIAREARRGHHFVASIEYNDFFRNIERQYAVIRTIEIIGEAAKRLPMSLRQCIPDIPWKDMAGMRDVLAHKFDKVDLRIVWDVARNQLPDLIDKIARYRQMIEVIVDMPSNWRVKRLSDVADIYMGQSPPSSSYNESGKGVAFLQGKAEFGEIFPRNTKWTTQPKRISAPWSILVSVRAPVGNVNISDQRYAIGRGLAEVRPKQHTDAWYLFFVLLYERPRLRSEASGTIFQSITKKTLQEFLILYPPLPEQRAIAHVLRTVQEAHEATVRVIAALRDLKRSLMRHLFTYGPVPVDAADQVALQDTPIGPIPAHWRVVRLGEVVHKTRQIDPRKTPDRQFKYIDVSSVSKERLAVTGYQIIQGENAPSRARKQVEKDDVIFATVRPYLKRIAKIPPELHKQICSTAFCVLRTRGNVLDSDFLFYIVSTDGFVARVSEHQRGSNYPAVTDKDVLEEYIPLPPLDEQREIARILQTVDRKIEAEEARKEALDALFRSLLHHLMTAKIRLPADFIAQFANEDTT